jgi:hypothetical protein
LGRSLWAQTPELPRLLLLATSISIVYKHLHNPSHLRNSLSNDKLDLATNQICITKKLIQIRRTMKIKDASKSNGKETPSGLKDYYHQKKILLISVLKTLSCNF